MENKNFVLIEVIEREISEPEFFETFEEAHAKMEEYFKSACDIDPDDDDWEDDVDGELDEWDAYCENANHDNCDWKIFQLNP